VRVCFSAGSSLVSHSRYLVAIPFLFSTSGMQPEHDPGTALFGAGLPTPAWPSSHWLWSCVWGLRAHRLYPPPPCRFNEHVAAKLQACFAQFARLQTTWGRRPGALIVKSLVLRGLSNREPFFSGYSSDGRPYRDLANRGHRGPFSDLGRSPTV
jgi:hypothetical protein